MSLSDLLRSKQDVNILIAIELIKGMTKKDFLEEMVILLDDLIAHEGLDINYYRIGKIRLSITYGRKPHGRRKKLYIQHAVLPSWHSIEITMSDPPRMRATMAQVNELFAQL